LHSPQYRFRNSVNANSEAFTSVSARNERRPSRCRSCRDAARRAGQDSNGAVHDSAGAVCLPHLVVPRTPRRPDTLRTATTTKVDVPRHPAGVAHHDRWALLSLVALVEPPHRPLHGPAPCPVRGGACEAHAFAARRRHLGSTALHAQRDAASLVARRGRRKMTPLAENATKPVTVAENATKPVTPSEDGRFCCIFRFGDAAAITHPGR
jgi:hypothetical protein